MNKNFLITGAANGIGLGYTRRALQSGGKVVLTDIDKEEGARQVTQLGEEFGSGRVCFVHLDVRNEEMWRNAWDEAETFFDGPVEVKHLFVSIILNLP